MKRIVYREWRIQPERYWGLLAILGTVAGIAGLAALYMEHDGHWVTGMTNQVVWGTPHVFAVFLIVAASGALNVASIGTVFGRTAYKPLGRLSGLLSDRPTRRRAAGAWSSTWAVPSGWWWPRRPTTSSPSSRGTSTSTPASWSSWWPTCGPWRSARATPTANPSVMSPSSGASCSPWVPAPSSASSSPGRPMTRRYCRPCSSSCPSPMGSRSSSWC